MMSNSWAGGPIAASGSGLTRLPLPVPVPQWLSLSGSQYPVPVAMLRHCWPAWGPTESRCHTVRQSHCDSHCGTVTVTRHTVTVTRSRCSAAAGWLQEVPRPRWPGVEIRLARSSQVGTGTVPTGPHGAPGTSGRARPGSGPPAAQRPAWTVSPIREISNIRRWIQPDAQHSLLSVSYAPRSQFILCAQSRGHFDRPVGSRERHPPGHKQDGGS